MSTALVTVATSPLKSLGIKRCKSTKDWTDGPIGLVWEWSQTIHQRSIKTGTSSKWPKVSPWLVQTMKTGMEKYLLFKGLSTVEQSQTTPLAIWMAKVVVQEHFPHGSGSPSCGWLLPGRSHWEAVHMVLLPGTIYYIWYCSLEIRNLFLTVCFLFYFF